LGFLVTFTADKLFIEARFSAAGEFPAFLTVYAAVVAAVSERPKSLWWGSNLKSLLKSRNPRLAQLITQSLF
jgi:hypothetical protein